MTEIAAGSPAPAVALPRDGGGTTGLKDYAGRKVVLYFYPKDDTSGCTTEAIAFSGLAEAFAAHDRFRDKHGLGVILLSDEAGDTAERYGVWGEKSMYGRTYMGIERATFLIDREGRVAQVWRKVKVPGHAEAVLAAAQAL